VTATPGSHLECVARARRLHLAAAVAESLPLLTADRDLGRAAKRHAVAAILLR
jgi:hypothetical protein